MRHQMLLVFIVLMPFTSSGESMAKIALSASGPCLYGGVIWLYYVLYLMICLYGSCGLPAGCVRMWRRRRVALGWISCYAGNY